MGEVQFAGNGGKDVFQNVSTAEAPSAQGSAGDAVQFAGDVGKQESKGTTDTSQHHPTKRAVPQGGGIQFAGNVGK